MFSLTWKKSAGMLVLAGASLVAAACASKSDVERAQTTADQALSAAQQSAQTAQVASQKADRADSEAAAASAKADRMYQQNLKK
jgi:Alanine-zipper, major outer membrane lipoprotein